jgi:hypothetical protein
MYVAPLDRMRRAITWSLLCLLPAAVFAAVKVRTYVLEAGVYDKLVIDDGEVWLGVYPAGDHAVIRTCKLRVRQVPNEDAYEEKATAVESTTNGPPLFLLKGAPAVRPGNVTSLYARSGDDVPDTLSLALGKNKYVLRHVETKEADGRPVKQLRLKLGAKEMELGNCPARDGIDPVWAGDLDGDGRLDLYVRIEHHNFQVEQLLYLSSADPTGKALTARAAVLRVRKLDD